MRPDAELSTDSFTGQHHEQPGGRARSTRRLIGREPSLGSLLRAREAYGAGRMRFADRRDAGRRLAALLVHARCDDPVVVGLLPEGLPVAAEIARALESPLEALSVEAVGAQGGHHAQIGAVAEGGACVVDGEAIRRLGLLPEEVRTSVAAATRELAQGHSTLPLDRPRLAVAGRSVILVDEGLCSPHAARAAAASLRNRGAARIVLAVPVADREASEVAREDVEEVVSLGTLDGMIAADLHYEDPSPTSGEEIRALMSEHVGAVEREVAVEVSPGIAIHGELTVPWGAYARGIVAIAGIGALEPLGADADAIAAALNRAAIGTLRLELLGPGEAIDASAAAREALLASRLVAATRWLRCQPETAGIALGYLGLAGAAPAAMRAAAQLKAGVCAVVVRAVELDLARVPLEEVMAPVLLILDGEEAGPGEDLRLARQRLRCESDLVELPRSAGSAAEASGLISDWFTRHLLEPVAGVEAGGLERAAAGS